MSRVARLVQSLGRLSLRPPVTIATPCHHVTQTKGLCSFAQLSQMSTHPVSSLTTPKFSHNCKLLQPTPVNTYHQTANMASLRQMHKKGPPKKAFFNRKTTMNGCAQRKGVVLKVLIKKPKKPNSANRKCVRVKLSTGRQIVAYIPGEGHNLQEHNIVLVRGGKKQDLPGVKHRVVRGKYDCSHVVKKTA